FVERVDFALNHTRQAGRLILRAYDQIHAANGKLRVRDVIFRLVIPRQRLAVFDVFDHAADLAPLRFAFYRDAWLDVFADGAFAGEMFLREGFVDDDDRQRLFVIALSEIAPGQHRNLHGVEIVYADGAEMRTGLFALRNVAPFNIERNHED